jgi:hypothetical protein
MQIQCLKDKDINQHSLHQVVTFANSKLGKILKKSQFA